MVENAVRLLYRSIYLDIEGMTFSSLEELNTAIRISLLDFNEKVMAGREMSRKEMFLQGEKDYLRPLPLKRYVVKERKLMTVGKNSYVSLFKHHYSVPKVKGTLEAELKKIERCQLLILDDLFIVPLDAKERPILLEIIEDRHERKSIIITSQYPSSNWYDMVGDPTIADAILDRIIHTAHTIELYGESMRKLRSKKNEKF